MDYLRRFLAESFDAVICLDAQQRIVVWNEEAARVFEVPAESAVGRFFSEVVNARISIVEQLLGAPLNARPVPRAQHTITRIDGSSASLEVKVIRSDPDGMVALIARDVTVRPADDVIRRREQRLQSLNDLRRETGQFSLLAEVVSLQVWTAQPNGGLDYANQEYLDYFGVNSPTEVSGDAWAQFVHSDDRAHVLDQWRSSLATGNRYEVECRLRGSDGEHRWFIIRARPMRDGTGAIARWFGSNTDIHDLKLAQGEAERANRAKDAFLAALSHELRTPLTPVLMTAAALRNDERLPADAREQLGMMERNIALEARLIDDLLDLTRIARGQLHLRSELVDAHSLIGLAVEIVRDDAKAKGIVLERELAAQQSGLVADPARFQQVIWNLLRNSVKFTPRGGRITIRTADQPGERGTGRLRIEVSDSGIGIDPAAIEKIFLPFEQGEPSDDHRFGGVGLGLAIARAIVDLHGGTIAAESAGRGRGSTFVVDLPGATEAPQGVAETPFFFELPAGDGAPTELAAPSRPVPLRLLVVEDHASTLEVLARLLERAGHHVVSAGTLASALAAAKKGEFDVVISDLGLPDGTGNELMEILRARYRLRGIALSGYGMEDDVARSRQAGFAAHLTKPVDFRQLQRALDEVMSGEVLA